jgi:hypothetical protein
LSESPNDLVEARKAFAERDTLKKDLEELQKNLQTANAQFDYDKMQLLFDTGASSCPSSGTPVFNPDIMSPQEKEALDKMMENLVRKSRSLGQGKERAASTSDASQGRKRVASSSATSKGKKRVACEVTDPVTDSD